MSTFLTSFWVSRMVSDSPAVTGLTWASTFRIRDLHVFQCGIEVHDAFLELRGLDKLCDPVQGQIKFFEDVFDGKAFELLGQFLERSGDGRDLLYRFVNPRIDSRLVRVKIKGNYEAGLSQCSAFPTGHGARER